MKCLSVIAFILVVLGALNWGLWGFFQFDIVAWLFDGNTTWMSRFIYAIVGLAGVWMLRCTPRCRQLCCSKGSCPCNCKCCNKNGNGNGSCKM